MIELLGILIVLGLAFDPALALVRWIRRRQRPHSVHSHPYRETVIVNLKSGKAFRGVLWQRTSGFLVLKNGELLRQREAPVGLDGDTLVPFVDVEFMQVVQQVKAG